MISFINKDEISKYLKQQVLLIEKELIYRLEYLVADLQNHAKTSAEYIDQTSNLKGSIGGCVLKDGKPISYKGFNGGGELGSKTGLEYLNSLISEQGSGYVILVVAGMNYASYVENYHNKNVLKKSELKMNRDLPEVFEKIKRRF
jgi:hypothetical protein